MVNYLLDNGPHHKQKIFYNETLQILINCSDNLPPTKQQMATKFANVLIDRGAKVDPHDIAGVISRGLINVLRNILNSGFDHSWPIKLHYFNVNNVKKENELIYLKCIIMCYEGG